MTNPPTRWEMHQLLGDALRPLVNPDDQFLPGADVNWKVMFEFASTTYVTPALALALRNSSAPGPEERQYLEVILTMNRERNIRLTQKLASTVQALSAAGIETVLLKGMASICDHLYPDFGGRVVSDADILVPMDKQNEAREILVALGFTRNHAQYSQDQSPPDWEAMHHGEPMGDAETGLWIELHTSVLAARHAAILTGEDAFRWSVPSRLHNIGVKIMSPEHRLTHAIAHIQLGHNANRDLWHMPQQHLECAMLMAAHPDRLEAVRKRFAQAGFLRAFKCAVAVCAHIYGIEASSNSNAEPLYIAMLKWAANHPKQAHLYRKAAVSPRVVWAEPRRLMTLLTLSGWRKLFAS